MKNTVLTLCVLLSTHIAIGQAPKRYDVVISEIMANPSAAVSLPNAKYIELHNNSHESFDLRGWTISDGTQTARITTNFFLAPDSFIVISSNNGAAALSSIVNVIAVTNFPTLRVNGDLLILSAADNLTIHAVAYNRSWYNNEVKSAGGWSLEMVDTKNPCGEANWKASTNDQGGTPGFVNSVNAINTDVIAPQIKNAYPNDSLHLTVRFSKTLDSASAAVASHYRLNNISISKAGPIAPLFNSVQLSFLQPLQRGPIYTLTVSPDIIDCAGNRISGSTTTETGMPEQPEPSSVIINEILFNPPPDGVDYIELYNRSSTIINLKDLYITHRTGSGSTGSLKRISEMDQLFFPGDYIVLTENKHIVQQQFVVKDANTMIELASMPSMPNEAGTLLLFNVRGDTIDALSYNENWHFPLITNPKGVALEKTNPHRTTQLADNWHSAATSAGFGTPGYQNSQYNLPSPLQGSLSIAPKVFSPDNDGLDDYASIQYRFEEAGNVCSISIFDAQGRPVRKLVQNALCGREGFFTWDGLGENKQQLKMGIYIIVTEIYNLSGKTLKDKRAVTLARRHS